MTFLISTSSFWKHEVRLIVFNADKLNSHLLHYKHLNKRRMGKQYPVVKEITKTLLKV